MGTEINIVSGFLEAGKTSFINRILHSGLVKKNERVLVLLCEQGPEKLHSKSMVPEEIYYKVIQSKQELQRALFSRVGTRYFPDRIFIEYNGTWEISELLEIKLPANYRFGPIIHLVDGSTFNIYMSNMGLLMWEQISNCDWVILNRYQGLDKKSLNTVIQTIRNINRRVQVVCSEQLGKDQSLEALFHSRPVYRTSKLFLIFVSLWLVYLLLQVFKLPELSSQLALLQTINTVFLGILIQAVVFVLIGVFVSSILQVLIPDDKLAGIFTRSRKLGYPFAIFAGIFFPVCDCGMVPIASRLIRKGVPLPQAMTFMLAAPAVNPIVIASTLYAFPGQPQIAVCRILLGIIIALAVGLLLDILPLPKPDLNGSFIGPGYAVGYFGNGMSFGPFGKTAAVFRHAGMEFLNVGRYVVAGAFISAVVQTAIPKTLLAALGNQMGLSLAVMILAAFFMSVCSSSNAFIGRSFANAFPINAVLGFMVMGPMLDMKNLLMLTGSFRKRFVLLLVGLLLGTAFSVFYLFSILV